VLEFAHDARSMAQLMALCGRADRTRFRSLVVRPLLDAGILGMTIPDKPRSSTQKYRLTEKGQEALKRIK